MSESNDTALALTALQAAIQSRRPPPGIIHHSDRGSPYGADDYITALDEHGFVRSMSRKGDINLEDNTVRCPGGHLVLIRELADGSGGLAAFKSHCGDCPLKNKCTKSKAGRTIRVHAKEETLHRSRVRQRCPEWKKNYRAVRPKVERKFAHLMRRRHGGRRARVRGRTRVGHDFSLLCAFTNLKRCAVLLS